MPDRMNFRLGGTICLAHAHGQRNNQTKKSCVISLAQYIYMFIFDLL